MRIGTFKEGLDPALFGEKAASLSRMTRGGFPVPAGFALSKGVFLKYHIEKEDSASLRPLIAQGLATLSADKYMVRSSAIGEDGEAHSFAGQLDSFICSNSIDDILAHVQKCWNAYDRENVQCYQASSKQRLEGMGVVIQELIDPDFAGVIFTRSHVKANALLVEYVSGHGEQLVSGDVNPLRFHCHLHDMSCEGDVLDALLPGLEIAQRIEQHYSKPMDIEWAMKDGVFWLVQARPITTKWKAPQVFWSNTNVNENYPDPLSPLLYSIARKSYYHYFKNLARLFQLPDTEISRLESAFSNVIGAWGGKMYYNMSSIHAILSASPFSKLLMKSFDNFVGYNDGEKSANSTKVPWARLNFVRVFLGLDRRLMANVVHFEERSDAYSHQVKNAVVLEHFRANFHTFMEIRLHSWYRASIADFFAMVYHGLLGKFCEKYYGEEATGIQNKLIQAIPNLISSKPVLQMHSLLIELRKKEKVYAAFKSMDEHEFYTFISEDSASQHIKDAIEVYLDNWGFRCSGELMLTVENYRENPAKFIALLRQYDGLNGEDPARLIEKKYEEAKQTKHAFRRKIWRTNTWNIPKTLVDLWLLGLLVRKASRGISARERVRLKQASLYFEFKKSIKAIEQHWISKGVLDEKGDIYFLTSEEIAELLDDSTLIKQSLKSILLQRKKDMVHDVSLLYPDEFSTELGSQPLPEELHLKEQPIDINAKVLHGMCACGGTLEGTVKVLDSVMEAGKLNPGDILVTRQTDPGWVVVFPLIRGLIVERGGMLSHGAIVSREFGIPAVVGVPKVTEILKDGDRITLYADRGEIVVHD